MQLHQAAVLREADNVRQANELIKEGWQLLAVLANSGEDRCLYTCYVLGKPKPVEPADSQNPAKAPRITDHLSPA